MIQPDGFRGAAFGTAVEGDARSDADVRRAMSRALGISDHWAFVSQVHGAAVIEATGPGRLGEADAVFTRVRGLPAAIGTADCVPVVVEADNAVAVIHAGWRGAAAGVVRHALDTLRQAGSKPLRAAIGPGIGPCCYEVGSEVAEHFPDHVSSTTWGTTSVDLPGVVAASLDGLEIWKSGSCTFTAEDMFSHRRNRTTRRQVAVAWLPDD